MHVFQDVCMWGCIYVGNLRARKYKREKTTSAKARMQKCNIYGPKKSAKGFRRECKIASSKTQKKCAQLCGFSIFVSKSTVLLKKETPNMTTVCDFYFYEFQNKQVLLPTPSILPQQLAGR